MREFHPQRIRCRQDRALPREFHQDVWNQTEALFDEEGNPGNNLMARIPRYTPNTRRSGRRRRAGGRAGQQLLRPSRTATATTGRRTARVSKFTGTPSPGGGTARAGCWRCTIHRIRPWRWGPTGVLPGSHYFNWLVGPIGLNMRLDTTEGEVPMAVEAGTVLMVHYDLWHRGMGNTHR